LKNLRRGRSDSEALLTRPAALLTHIGNMIMVNVNELKRSPANVVLANASKHADQKVRNF